MPAVLRLEVVSHGRRSTCAGITGGAHGEVRGVCAAGSGVARYLGGTTEHRAVKLWFTTGYGI